MHSRKRRREADQPVRGRRKRRDAVTTARACWVYGYIRVSTGGQEESALGLEAQTRSIQGCAARLAEHHSLSIGQLYQDAVSASRYPIRQREAGSRLDRTLQRGDHVVIAKLDRAFRNQRDCLLTVGDWIERGIVVHFLDLGVATNTPLGQMMMGIMAAIAQWEATRIGERIREAVASARARGYSSNGKRIHGYTVSRRGKLIPLASERALGKRAAGLRSKGWLLREIAEKFQGEKIRRPSAARSSKWNPQVVRRLIIAHEAGWPMKAAHVPRGVEV